MINRDTAFDSIFHMEIWKVRQHTHRSRPGSAQVKSSMRDKDRRLLRRFRGVIIQMVCYLRTPQSA